MDRRDFLTTSTAAGTFLLFNGMTNRASAFVETGSRDALKTAGYGPLFPVASKNTGETLLSLPKGFEYTAIGKVGKTMSDGRPTPSAHDGMATFLVGKELRVVRNHEVGGTRLPVAGSGIGSSNHYDEGAGGGTTTLVIDPKTRQIVKDFVSLSGTLINCAGGPTPWGSWISCEETTLGQTVRTDAKGKKSGGYSKPHGYCFEVPASANTNLPPVPLKAMGRFTHEAISVDPLSGVVYLTEDYGPCGFYRFLPNRSKRFADGGVLQMLKIKSKDNYDTRKNQKVGEVMEAEWVTITRPDPEEADVDPSAVFKEGASKGGATFSRLEGCTIDQKGRAYFDSTNGGNNGGGQIWVYEPVNRDSGRLILAYESPDRSFLDMPDNICFDPKSANLFICEDSDYVDDGGTSENYVRILTPEGKISNFACNIAPNFTKSEFAGSRFSPDGQTLFVNIQALGVTCAIWGPWSSFKA